MKIKPILFSSPMVQAILEGRKTQTRRIIKPQPDVRGLRNTNVEFEDWHGLEVKPKYQKGDILWVRETFEYYSAEWDSSNNDLNYSMVTFNYKATDGEILKGKATSKEFAKNAILQIENGKLKNSSWKPSIFMPKAACRIFLEITDVRVERLHDISEDAAIAEGIQKYGPFGEYKGSPHPNGGAMAFRAYGKAARAFQDLWESINGEGSWKANPAVFVYEFKRVEKPENFLV